jgi:hypothetical protein
MPPAWHLTPGVDLQEIVPYLSPGSVVGVFDDGGWVDWEIEPGALIVLLSGYDLEQRAPVDSTRFHFVIHNSTSQLSPARLGGALAILARRSRGVALVTSRIGIMLRAVHRVLSPIRDRLPVPRLSSSLPRPPRHSSGAWITPLARQWRLVDPAELVGQAMLSLQVEKPGVAARLLEDGCDQVRVDGEVLHLPLGRVTPEAMLERLSSRAVRVRSSAVWYPPLQSCPFEGEPPDVERHRRPG